jgi:hypothetical protein
MASKYYFEATKQDIILQTKSDYLNYIHFCEYYNCFNDVKYYLQEKLNKYSCIDNLFYLIEDKVGIKEEENKKNNESIILEL